MSYEETQYLSSAPRALPVKGKLLLYAGGVLPQIGWGIVAFGSIFFWAFSLPATIVEVIAFQGALESSQGKVVRNESTSVSINEENVVAVHFRFKALDGQWHNGISYRTGEGLRPGRFVDVEYKSGSPKHARIRGLRASIVGPWILLLLLIPGVGLLLVVLSLRKGRRAVHLLRNGRLALGELIREEETNVRINDEPVFKYVFAFEADDGRTYEVSAKTHRPERLLDDEQERVLYDPRDPSYALMLDNLPGKPDVDGRGHFVFAPSNVFLALLLPGVAIFLNIALSFWLL